MSSLNVPDFHSKLVNNSEKNSTDSLWACAWAKPDQTLQLTLHFCTDTTLIRTIVLRGYENKVVLPEGLFFVDLSEVGSAVYAGCCSFWCSLLHYFVFTSQYFDFILLHPKSHWTLKKNETAIEQLIKNAVQLGASVTVIFWILPQICW